MILKYFKNYFQGSDKIQDWAKTADDKRLQEQKDDINNDINDKEKDAPHNILTDENQDAERQDKISEKIEKVSNNEIEKDATKINEDNNIQSIVIVNKDGKAVNRNLDTKDSFKNINDLKEGTSVDNETKNMTASDKNKSEELPRNTSEVIDCKDKIISKEENKTMIIEDTTSENVTNDIHEFLIEIKHVNIPNESLIKDMEKEKVQAINYDERSKYEIDNGQGKHQFDYSFENKGKNID